ncbi:MAG TPA: S41 family peptidase [Terriglobales bacterium]|nr:S41 family peptidase [Terriglobales bacterium]
MSKKISASILVVSAAILIFTVVGGLDRVRASDKDGAYPQIEVYSEVLSRVEGEYVEDPNIPAVTNGALHGLLESLDSDSSYLTPEQYSAYKERKEAGAKADIGATVSKRFGYATIVAVIPGGPADKIGLQDTDIIESIGGKSTHDMSVAEIRSLLSGHPGTTINVELVRARRAEPQKAVFTLQSVAIPPVTDKLLDNGIGYLKMDSLNQGKVQDIANKIKSLEKQGAKKFILDLRDCAGGEESEGIAVANLFLNHGTITYLQGQKYPRKAFSADSSKAVTALPVVVLVNKGTAGAAEIVASAILDNGRGDVIGDKTFGEGSVQNLIDLKDGSALILTVAKYYSPNGKAIQDSAVTPNILVADNQDIAILPDDDETTAPTPQEDLQKAPRPDDTLQKAIQVLGKKS